MSKPNVIKLRMVRDVLWQPQVKEHFNYNTWYKHRGTSHTHTESNPLGLCGTSGCALGWGTTVPELGMKLLLNTYGTYGMVVPSNSTLSYYQARDTAYTSLQTAMQVFDLTWEEANYLFIPDSPLLSTTLPISPEETAPPSIVAAHIERFCRWAEGNDYTQDYHQLPYPLV